MYKPTTKESSYYRSADTDSFGIRVVEELLSVEKSVSLIFRVKVSGEMYQTLCG
jgi:hypothetical protein